jgi:lactate dehydrogenase-like 2-hydroxyacid dehydrogenase
MAFGMSMNHSIVFLDRGTLGAELRAPGFPHSYQEYAATPAQLVTERLRDATIAIINKVPMPAETLAQLPKLRLIAVAATGTDIVDKDYCRVKGITVVNIRDYAFNTVPEHVFALIFALRRNLIAYREDVRNGAWQRAEQFCFSALSDLVLSARQWRAAQRPWECECLRPTSCSRRASSTSRQFSGAVTLSHCMHR